MRDKVLSIYAKLFAKQSFLRLNRLLFDMSLRGMGVLNYKGFEISGETFFHDFLQKNYTINTVFDVGANSGDYTELFKDSSRVYAFEPNPKSYRNLEQQFLNHASVRTFNFGLSDVEETVKIYDRVDNEGSRHASIYQEVITDIHKAESVGVDISLRKLDTVVQEENIESISLLKIDTEGNELAVLKGGIQTISKQIVDVIHIEFNEMNIISKVFLKDFVDLLPSYNFYRLLPNGFLPIHYNSESPVLYEIFAFQNIIAFRKDIDKVTKAGK